MKYLLTFLSGLGLGALSFYLALKNYAPIEVGRANCYTDGHYKIRLQAELNFPKSEANPTGDNKDYSYMGGQTFHMLALNEWRPCNPAEYRIQVAPPTYEWEFPGVSEEDHYKGK